MPQPFRAGMRAEMRTERGWPRWVPHGLAADVLLAVGVGGVVLVGTSQADELPGRALDALAVALVVASAAPLVWRRKSTVAALWAVVAVVTVYMLVGYRLGPNMLPFAIMLYTAAAEGRRGQGILAALVWVVSAVGGLIVLGPLPDDSTSGTDYRMWADDLDDIVGFVAYTGLLIAAGEIVRGRRAYLAEAARSQEEAALRRVEEERLRIARELHDVLAHSISLISLQAGVAVRLLDRKPEQARAAMLAVRHASKDALAELRATLDTLRDVDDDAPRHPTPGLDRLEALVGNATAAGLGVEVEVTGERRVLPVTVDVAAYRVVQEALTNVARHTAPARATVTLAYAPQELTVQIDDDGHGSAASSSQAGGSGLIGLRERVASVGGELEAGPRPAGGWRVHARLPATLDAPDGPDSPDTAAAHQDSRA